MKTIAALFVLTDGPYFNLPGVEPYDLERDAFTYKGPHPVIAHPPCERWGRYWSGGPSAKIKRILGDDGGAFEFALASVRKFGGLLEHPEASHAFRRYDLPIPKWRGGWTEPDSFGGRSACVAQGNYGHRARKMTWLYAKIKNYPKLIWGGRPGMQRLDQGFHSAEERRRAIKGSTCRRLSKRQCAETPIEFRDLLLRLVRQ